MTGSPTGWILFNAFVLVMLALDLGVFHRKAHVVKIKEAFVWTGVWIALALGFNLGIYLFAGSRPALEFLTGYLIEKSLSVDNIFVFLMVFGYFKIPQIRQHKILFWGILGALVMRAAFIFAGIALIERFHWITYLFGGFLVATGAKMATKKEVRIHPERNPLLAFIKRRVPVTPDLRGGSFLVKERSARGQRWTATPMLICLLFIEATDLIFAVDSIPAILAITSDPFIVYTSNVFAILGLRSLYFALARTAELFEYLHYGLAAVLIFVGAKMLAAGWYKLPPWATLCVIMLILAVSVAISIRKKRITDEITRAKQAKSSGHIPS